MLVQEMAHNVFLLSVVLSALNQWVACCMGAMLCCVYDPKHCIDVAACCLCP